jgi:hypothetical protein
MFATGNSLMMMDVTPDSVKSLREQMLIKTSMHLAMGIKMPRFTSSGVKNFNLKRVNSS